MTRPRGIPPIPSAMSSDNAPVGIEVILSAASASPRRIIDPLPCSLTISSIAIVRFFSRVELKVLSPDVWASFFDGMIV